MEIKLNSKMNKSVIDALTLRGDNISLYAVALIKKLQEPENDIEICNICNEINCECDE